LTDEISLLPKPSRNFIFHWKKLMV